MIDLSPAAGWYQDPTSAGQRRWWDGQAWTGYTEAYPPPSPPPVPVPPPVVASPYGYQQQAQAAPNYASPHDSRGGLVADASVRSQHVGSRATFEQAPRSWYRKKRYGLAVGLVVIAAVVVVANAHKSTGNQSAALSASIMTTAPAQLEKTLQVVDPGSAAQISVLDASCIQTAGTQQYTCSAHFSATDPTTGETLKLVVQIAGTCDSQADCQWHATGPGQQVG